MILRFIKRKLVSLGNTNTSQRIYRVYENSFDQAAAIASLAILFAGCSGTFGLVGDAYKTSDYGPPSQGSGEVAEAGLLTAGEWNDLSNWDFWGGLLNNKEFQVYESFWNMYTYNRVAVKVSYPGGEPAIGVKVLLSKDNEEIWQAVTDNIGEAECWVSYFQKDSTVINDPDSWADFKISLNGEAREAAPIFSKRGEAAALNSYTITSSTPRSLRRHSFHSRCHRFNAR